VKKLTARTLAITILAVCASVHAQPAAEAPDPVSALLAAAREGDVKTIKRVLASGVKVDAKNHYDVTALFVAALFDRADAAKVLIAKGADIKAAKGGDGSTALHSASFLCYGDVVKLLLDKGADVDTAASQGETPLHLAPGHDSAEIRDWVAFHTGAPVVEADRAMFALGTWPALAPRDRFAIGTPDYPDRSATLIVEVERLAATGPRLTGPGIEAEARLALPEITAFRANRALFPLGLDFFFTAGDRLAALPRSTTVEDA